MALIPKFCGEPGTMIPEDACGSITFEGVDDVTINQGVGIDLLEGVKAYDKNGVEIPVVAEPSEIPKCEVGEHTVEYKAIGEADKFAPHIFCGDNKIKAADCQISIETEDRVITIEQADPPTINGIDELDLPVGGTANLMNGVSGMDDNGNPAEVEYLGGVMSDVAEDDDIATFDTDIEAPLKSLQLTLSPQQDCTPWIGTDHDTTPYLHRAMPTQSNDYNRESGVIVGGTVGWNQLVQNGNFADTTGWSGVSYGTLSASNNVLTYTITEPSGSARIEKPSFAPIKGHKLLCSVDINPEYVTTACITLSVNASGSYVVSKTLSTNVWTTLQGIKEVSDADVSTGRIRIYAGSTNASAGEKVLFKNCVIFDLTAIFGTTIADYIYSLEQVTAGAGVAWFRRYFPEDYYPYHAVSLESVQATAHKTYDGDGNVIGNYALDSSLTLRGIPKLDASNNLYYDGDTYESDGTVTRKYGIVDLGTLGWSKYNASSDAIGEQYIYGTTGLNGLNKATAPVEITCITNKYIGALNVTSNTAAWQRGNMTCSMLIVNGDRRFYVRDDSLIDKTPAEFKSAMSGVYLVYELATPTTETATAYTNPQIVDPNGTESYTDYGVSQGDRDVAIPVGHESTYANVCPISGWTEIEVTHKGKNLLDKDGIVWTVGIRNDDGDIISGQSHFTNEIYGIKPNEQYTISGTLTTSSSSYRLYYLKKDGTWISRTGTQNAIPLTFTTPNDCGAIQIQVSTLIANLNDVQVELGSTATDYEPYQGQTYTATLPETVYGGTVDLVSGEVVIDRAMVTINGGAGLWSTPTGDWIGAYNGIPDMTPERVYGLGCNMLTSNREYVTTTWNIYGVGSVVYYCLNRSVVGDGIASVNAWLAENPLEVVYPLATPRTIQLTPQEIQTLLGTNNVWSEDADHVEVIFLKSIPQDDAQFNVDGVYAVDYIATDECGNQTVKTRLIYVGDAECEPLEDENGNPLQTEIGEILCYEEGLPCAVTCESAVCECVVCCD